MTALLPKGYRIFSFFSVKTGFIFWDVPGVSFLYRYADDTLTELPAEAGLCFDILQDGDVLCSAFMNGNFAPGIHRYNPDEDVYTILVEDGYIAMI